MDKELPWLADNAQLELKYKKGKTPLSHRKWPGEPVPVITESIIQTLGDKLLQKAEKKKNIVWRYENFSLEWQSAITQAINLIGEHKPSIPARTMAALVCIAQNDSQQLLDEIVQQEGLEYATEVVIARQFITRCYESDPLLVTLQYQDEDYGYGYRSETYNEFDLRLRKHLSLAEESSWQRCADKLIAALPGIPKIRRPFIALLLPEKPEIANELASLESSRSSLHSKEWLKVIATDNTAVKKLERYWGLDVFSDREASYMSQENRFGYAAWPPFCANKDWQPFRAWQCMPIKKIAAVCWYKLTIRKSSAPCYWWLIKTNPACNVWLNTVKTSPTRRSPHWQNCWR